ncbi:MAG: hypothetical protein ACR2QK_09445, partial [Acidimicrobiales bacterium]
MFGLWAAACIIGLVSGGAGALINEYQKQRAAASDPRLAAESNLTMLSGFGYLAGAMIAGWFPAVLTVAVLVGILADFGAGHHIARSQLRQPTNSSTDRRLPRR